MNIIGNKTNYYIKSNNNLAFTSTLSDIKDNLDKTYTLNLSKSESLGIGIFSLACGLLEGVLAHKKLALNPKIDTFELKFLSSVHSCFGFLKGFAISMIGGFAMGKFKLKEDNECNEFYNN